MKKGFTLVELLAVLVILGAITIIAVPNIINTNKKAVENDYNEFKKTVENAAEVYLETHPSKKDEISSNGSVFISFTFLKDGGYISNNLVNPKTGTIDANAGVSVTKESDTYKYEYQEG